jgi:hypothetical protein
MTKLNLLDGFSRSEAPQFCRDNPDAVLDGISRVRELDFLDLLPASFPLDGRPFNIKAARPMFAPLFRKTPLARKQIFMSARQVGKTASIGGHACMNCSWREGFRYLYVAPLAIYVSRFHHLYMAKMLRGKTIPWDVQDKHCVSNVSEKTFSNGSHFHGVSCFNSAGNALGLPSDVVSFDEIQDLNFDFIPQILETLGTSDFRYENYFGTARGTENTIQKLYDTSSQGEFAIRCHCNYWNIPSLDQDVLGMIQKKGISCVRCSSLLDVEQGQWVHAYPDRVEKFVGWHIPQTIVKARIQPYDRYLDTIYDKLHGVRKYSMSKYLNEVLGISVEMGSTPITPAQIRTASILDISPTKPFQHREYSTFGGGVDWGGAEITSFTVGTIVGLHQSGIFHCVNAIRPTGIPENERHLPISKFFQDNCPSSQMFAILADGAFVGGVQNRNLGQVSGFQVGSVFYGTMKKLFIPGSGNAFTVDRTTILFIIYSLIKNGQLLFPSHETFQSFTDDLKSNFVEEVNTQRGTIQRYQRYATMPDDFLHSLGYALLACAIGSGVDLSEMVGLGSGSSVTKDYIDAIGTEMPIHPGVI